MATSSRERPILYIVVPVFNEAENFPQLYKAIKKQVKMPHRLVVVYDFDKDTTVPVAKKYAQKDPSIVLHKNTIGRGALNAVKSGLAYVKTGPVLVTMADLCDDLSLVSSMYEAYLEGAAVVVGSRYMPGGKQLGGPLFKRTLSRVAGVSLYWFRRFPTHDITNNFKLYDKQLLNEITIESEGGFEVAMEITAKAFRLRKRIVELPTTWQDRTAGEANFQLWQWLPSYLHWYFYAWKPRIGKDAASK